MAFLKVKWSIADEKIDLPEWKDAPSNGKSRKCYNLFMAALIKHEKEHSRQAHEYLENADPETEFKGRGTSPSREAAREAARKDAIAQANDVKDDLEKEIQKLTDAYDAATNNGFPNGLPCPEEL